MQQKKQQRGERKLRISICEGCHKPYNIHTIEASRPGGRLVWVCPSLNDEA